MVQASISARHPKLGIRGIVAGVLLFLCLAYGYFYLISTATSGEDVLACKAITDPVIAEHGIPESVSASGRPAIFCDLEVRGFFLKPFEHISIYGVTDKEQQDSILRTLEHFRPQSKARRMVVDFYEKENWKTWSNPATGNRGGEGGPETPIRTIVIK